MSSRFHPLQRVLWQRDTFHGSLLFNIAAFILPALYGTLSKLWVARLDASRVVTTDSFIYMNTAAEALNEGLPRAAWVIIGDKSSRALGQRLHLTHTLIAFQATMGLLLSIIFLVAAPRFAESFVPESVRQESVSYVRIISFTVLSSTVETATATASRALDHPDVPLIISSIKFAVNIVLDLSVISRFHIGSFTPTVNTQGVIQLVCNLVSALAGLVYFLCFISLPERQAASPASSEISVIDHDGEAGLNLSDVPTTFRALKVLFRPGLIFFAESAVRNALYLWLVTTIVDLGPVYSTAWGIFNTIRWGLVMVPVQALEATTLQFIGHQWGEWRESVGVDSRRPKASWGVLLRITRPALQSLILALIIEIPMAIFLSLFGARPFAKYISDSDEVADVTAHMWRTIDWCYIFYAMSTQLATVLTATRPKWYLYQSLASNLLYVLPWAIVCQVVHLNESNAWTYHSLVFGGSLVFSFFDIAIIDGIWAWTLAKGQARLEVFQEQ